MKDFLWRRMPEMRRPASQVNDIDWVYGDASSGHREDGTRHEGPSPRIKIRNGNPSGLKQMRVVVSAVDDANVGKGWDRKSRPLMLGMMYISSQIVTAFS